MAEYTIRRLNKIKGINFGLRYLEIGVNRGSTFNNLNFDIKDAVDPNFLFKTDQYETPKHRFFKMTSDEFWTSTYPLIYDIIFLDGLHTFEQVFRDLLCSKRFSHKNTVWLIDDTLPCDMISAIKDQNISLQLRSKYNLEGMSWHGDVFKIIPAIREYLPTFDFATITGPGNPQTIVWYSSNVEYKSINFDFERISRFQYIDIEKFNYIFNFFSEDEAFEYFKNSFSIST